jgi:histidinol-phosphate phosphatase family protein
VSARAAFLDRDGTLNLRPPEHEYVRSVDDFQWLPGAIEGLARLHRAGYLLAVVSNQQGVARGVVSRSTLLDIEARIQEDLRSVGCQIGAFRYCVHAVEDRCACRKPEPGLLRDLARELDLAVSQSWMIGDAESDVEAGRAAGCRTALVGASSERADIVADSLDEASRLIAGARSAAARS